MNKAQAYRHGVASGYEAGVYGEFTAKELGDEDAFAEAAAEMCDNQRQFAEPRSVKKQIPISSVPFLLPLLIAGLGLIPAERGQSGVLTQVHFGLGCWFASSCSDA